MLCKHFYNILFQIIIDEFNKIGNTEDVNFIFKHFQNLDFNDINVDCTITKIEKNINNLELKMDKLLINMLGKPTATK